MELSGTKILFFLLSASLAGSEGGKPSQKTLPHLELTLLSNLFSFARFPYENAISISNNNLYNFILSSKHFSSSLCTPARMDESVTKQFRERNKTSQTKIDMKNETKI